MDVFYCKKGITKTWCLPPVQQLWAVAFYNPLEEFFAESHNSNPQIDQDPASESLWDNSAAEKQNHWSKLGTRSKKITLFQEENTNHYIIWWRENANTESQ